MEYRRNRTAGGTYFFTINLAQRSNGILIKNIDGIVYAIKQTKIKYPFKIEAYVFLPDHMHLMMTLPENNSNYSIRISMIKSLFSKQVPWVEAISVGRKNKRAREIWQYRFLGASYKG